MMKIIVSLLLSLVITGCAETHKFIPSFWDDNQSNRAADIRLTVERIDCGSDYRPTVSLLRDQVDGFILYSESKGSAQQDVIAVYKPMQQTVNDFYARTQPSRVYCELKKKILREQSQRAAATVMGRW